MSELLLFSLDFESKSPAIICCVFESARDMEGHEAFGLCGKSQLFCGLCRRLRDVLTW